jgi:hypothetical protein
MSCLGAQAWAHSRHKSGDQVVGSLDASAANGGSTHDANNSDNDYLSKHTGSSETISKVLDPASKAFFSQTCFASTLYDVLPIVPLSRAAAKLCCKPHQTLIFDLAPLARETRPAPRDLDADTARPVRIGTARAWRQPALRASGLPAPRSGVTKLTRCALASGRRLGCFPCFSCIAREKKRGLANPGRASGVRFG